MNGDAELLNFVYQNAQMGVNTLEQLHQMTEAGAFREQLACQLREYAAISDEAKRLLHKSGRDEKDIGSFDKLKTYLMINMQTLNDRSPSHIAQMLITGGTMGIVQATRCLDRYGDAQPEILGLMKRLLAFEEQSAEKLKEFL